MGCGISGLTASHYLSKYGFDVTIFERHEFCGGLARSREFDKDGNKVCPSEYSWRSFTPFYFNTFSMLKEIPSPAMG
jgi:uncharacterized protein with NAD-binding domain and iron-sulfur cluster